MRNRAFPRVMAKARPAPINLQRPAGVESFAPDDAREGWRAGIRALQTGDNVITIFEDIGYDWWTGGGVTAKGIAAQLRAIGPRPIEVQINSPGGDMFEGLAIYNLLRDHPQPITVKVLGIAASAASIIAMAGDDIMIGQASFLMIHNCWVMAMGNRHDMRKVADTLEPFDAACAGLYASRSGQSEADCAGWLDAETYMNGAQAIERGFADALLPADAITEDTAVTAKASALNEVRNVERMLVSGGMTRSQARAHIAAIKGVDINQLRGMPDAAPDTGTPGAAEHDGWDAAAFAAATGLLATLRA
jgi:ATP-dependent protease ClpP protease subunit